MSLRIILVFTAFIEDMLKLNLVCFFLFCYENELNDRTIIRTFRTPLVLFGHFFKTRVEQQYISPNRCYPKFAPNVKLNGDEGRVGKKIFMLKKIYLFC